MPGMDCYRAKAEWLADHPGPDWIKITPFPVLKYHIEPRSRDADVDRQRRKRAAPRAWRGSPEARARIGAASRARNQAKREARAREEEALEAKQLERLERRLDAIEISLAILAEAIGKANNSPAAISAKRERQLEAKREYMRVYQAKRKAQAANA